MNFKELTLAVQSVVVNPGTVSAKNQESALTTIDKQRVMAAYTVLTPIPGNGTGKLPISRLDKEHLATRETSFALNQPFYTCLEGLTNIWIKEFPNGEISFIKRTYNWETSQPIEEVL